MNTFRVTLIKYHKFMTSRIRTILLWLFIALICYLGSVQIVLLLAEFTNSFVEPWIQDIICSLIVAALVLGLISFIYKIRKIKFSHTHLLTPLGAFMFFVLLFGCYLIGGYLQGYFGFYAGLSRNHLPAIIMAVLIAFEALAALKYGGLGDRTRA